MMMKEFDMDKLGKGAKQTDTESAEIFGISGMPEIQVRQGHFGQYQYNRVVFKSNKSDASSGSISIKQSLLKK